MRVLLAILFFLAGSTAMAAPSDQWKITKDHWDADDERRFGEFVAGFGEHSCSDPASCFRSSANPYRDSDPPTLKMDGDCADFISEDGDKGKVTLRYRGREITHQDIGMRLLERIRDELADVAVVEHMPKLEGRQMIMVLAPKRK